jgi:hypothetical protein
VCITAGLLAFAQYFAIVYFTASHWALNNSVYSPYPYGLFSWSAQISRLIIMLTASALSLALVSRSQRLLQMATSDHLTGLFNRGYVDDRESQTWDEGCHILAGYTCSQCRNCSRAVASGYS